MTEPSTNSARIAEEYIRLGGKRRLKLDDNIVSTRQWEDEPQEAAAFWEENVASLPDDQRREIEGNLPNINPD